MEYGPPGPYSMGVHIQSHTGRLLQPIPRSVTTRANSRTFFTDTDLANDMSGESGQISRRLGSMDKAEIDLSEGEAELLIHARLHIKARTSLCHKWHPSAKPLCMSGMCLAEEGRRLFDVGVTGPSVLGIQ